MRTTAETPIPAVRANASRGVAVTDEIDALLAKNAVVAVGVSGGRDSQACAVAVAAHLDRIGHTGPRVLIHSDLGRVEWRDSAARCEELAARLGWELITVRRKAGDLLARWQGRWEANLRRYSDLSCVKLILPWATPAMRFCTSELKVAVICSALRARYPTHDIVNAAGVRREESAARSKMPVYATMAKLERKGRAGVSWNPIIEWKLQEVIDEIQEAGLTLHEAYTRYGSSRVSCAFCIMSSGADLLAALGCADNHDLYREMVQLEIDSTFAFQGARWLGDVAPHLLTAAQREGLQRAKAAALERQQAEALIPPHLLYVKGWPVAMPTAAEAELIAAVRRRVAAAVGIQIGFTEPQSILQRYAELLEAKGLPVASSEVEYEATELQGELF